MKSIPTLKQITKTSDLEKYSDKYEKCSGLPIPQEYMTNSINRVFGIFLNNKLIGGFILGRDIQFRTIQFFAKEHKQESVINQLGDLSKYTEICCFWIDKKNRTNTFINLFVWLSMTYALRFYGTKYFLFGTCSRSLARLYGQTSKSIQIHRDRINNKATFIFRAHRSSCVTGMLEIISHKLKRSMKITNSSNVFMRFNTVIKQKLQMI